MWKVQRQTKERGAALSNEFQPWNPHSRFSFRSSQYPLSSPAESSSARSPVRCGDHASAGEAVDCAGDACGGNWLRVVYVGMAYVAASD